jgi:hypothetical protein
MLNLFHYSTTELHETNLNVTNSFHFLYPRFVARVDVTADIKLENVEISMFSEYKLMFRHKLSSLDYIDFAVQCNKVVEALK